MVCDIFDPNQEQVLIDLETLGTKRGSIIVAIGATRFTLAEGILRTFLINIDPFDSKKYGLKTDKDTIDWWKNQPKTTSDLWKQDQKPLKEALAAFEQWYGPKSVPTWGNSPRFDLCLLEDSFDAVGAVAYPWKFRDECDVRMLGKIIALEWGNEGIPHYAMDDAVNETEAVLKALRS